MTSDNWVFTESFEDRDEALEVLARVKEARRNRQYKIVRLDARTWREVEINRHDGAARHHRRTKPIK